MIQITAAILLKIRPDQSPVKAVVAADKLAWALPQYQIDTPLRVAHLLAQLAHKSGFMPIAENLSYSAKRMMQVWPTRFPRITVALPYERNPEALGNFVYANAWATAHPRPATATATEAGA